MISVCVLLKTCLILYGILFLIRSILSLARRQLTESLCVFWSVLSVIMIFAGFLLNPTGLDAMISIQGFVLVLLTCFAIMEAMYSMTRWISKLERQSRELTMQVALLRSELESLSAKDEYQAGELAADAEEDFIRHQHDGVRWRRDGYAESDRVVSS